VSDVASSLAQAKTGTGKTLAFLIPAIESLIRLQAQQGNRQLPAKNISVLILSPTRELATQIAAEAETLLRHHPFRVQCVYGGTNINGETKRLQSARADILVATPGRLLDHLQNGPVRSMVSALTTVILDEADRLLDQGFARELRAIFELLPDRKYAIPFAPVNSALMLTYCQAHRTSDHAVLSHCSAGGYSHCT
jgi:ATP-dependent RNA helicase MSS116